MIAWLASSSCTTRAAPKACKNGTYPSRDEGNDGVVRLVPATLVDLLPASWWRPGNHRLLANRSIHFCVNADDVRTIELDGKEISRGWKRFDYGDEWGQEPADR